MADGRGHRGRAEHRETPREGLRRWPGALVLAVVVALLAAAVATAVPARPAAAQPRGSARVAPEVEEKVATGEEVRVIAATDAPGDQVVDEVAAALPGGSARDISAGSAPQVVATVDAEGLDALRDAPGVTAVVEDKVNRLESDSWPSVIGLPPTHAAGWDGSGRTVAVLDAGVQADHPFLGGKVVAQACFSSNGTGLESLCPGGAEIDTTSPDAAAPCTFTSGCGHGTHVAGLAVGVTDAAPPLTGTASGASLIAVKVFSKGTTPGACGGATAPCLVAFDSDIIEALTWLQVLVDATDPLVATLDAVNLSLGGGTYGSTCDSLNPVLTASIEDLRASGVATVAAAGNNGVRGRIASPACISSVVSVGATTGTGSVASFSNVSTFTTLLAPGSVMTSSIPVDTYAAMSGTSMATPVVAGSIVILRQRAPGITVPDLVNVLQATGDPISVTLTSGLVNLPEVQLDAAVDALPGTVPSAPRNLQLGRGDQQVSVSWTPPIYVGGGITGYTVSTLPASAGCSTASTSCVVTGLTNGTSYEVYVTATNSRGIGGPVHGSATPATVPTAPQGVVGTAGVGEVTVAWSPPASDGGAEITAYDVVASPGGASCDTGGATSCTVGPLVDGVAYTFQVTATNEVGTGPASAPSASVVPDLGSYTALTPTRVLDTRAGQPVGTSSRDVVVAGVGAVPGDAVAVVVNVTVTEPTASSYLTVYPAGQSVPTASNLNYVAGQTVPNLVVVKVGAGGAISLYNKFGTTDVVLDIVGYYRPHTGERFTSMTPTRVLDTRAGQPVGTSSRDVVVAGVGAVPGDAVAVVVNVTVTEPTASSYLTVYPAGQSVPTASNLNYVAGQTVPNLVVVKVGAGGAISLYNKFGTTDVVLDIVGYYAPSSTAGVKPLAPTRVLDTRAGQPVGTSSRDVVVAGVGAVPGDAVAVVVNVTVTEPTASSYLTVYPAGQSVPTASNLNYVAGQTVPNLVVVKVGAGGAISLYNKFGTTDVVLDVVGYYLSSP